MGADEITRGKIKNCVIQHGSPKQKAFAVRNKDCLRQPGHPAGRPFPLCWMSGCHLEGENQCKVNKEG